MVLYPMARSVILSLGGALVAMVLGPGCDSSAQSECHRQQLERSGCCPTCDAECRAAITVACAGVHDEPLVDAEVGTSDDGGEPDDTPSDPPMPPTAQPAEQPADR
ncbi:MAG: hypothetical protein AAGF11_14335 [Myxococcota bacterium]